MIYTVTLNPSLDYIVGVENLTVGKVNRTCDEVIFPGGKGINVSLMLRNLGLDSIALGFVAGFTGEEIIRRLAECDIQNRFITLKEGNSRINVKLRSIETNVSGDMSVGAETEVNGNGPVIGSEAIDDLYAEIDRLSPDDTLVISGSIPSSLPTTIYKDILERVNDKGVKTVVDASGSLLVNVLSSRPFLIKPNNHELCEIAGRDLATTQDIVDVAVGLTKQGARNVLVSMAGEGAILVAEDGSVYVMKAPSGKVINSVGAGDSMVAGFIYGYEMTSDYREALKLSIAAGSASAFSTGFASKEDVDKLLNSI